MEALVGRVGHYAPRGRTLGLYPLVSLLDFYLELACKGTFDPVEGRGLMLGASRLVLQLGRSSLRSDRSRCKPAGSAQPGMFDHR